MSSSSFFIKEMTESEGTEGAMLKTAYPLLTRRDSIIMQPKLCNSPSGVHNIIFLVFVDDEPTRLETFSFINFTSVCAALLQICSVATSKTPLLHKSPTVYITGVSSLSKNLASPKL